MPTPKTINILLLEGTPNGVKIIELANKLVRAYLIPRIQLNHVKGREDLNQPAIYFLFDKEGKKLYIGESENFYDRVKNHDQNKEFWETAIAFIARDNSLEKSDVKFLEHTSVIKGKSAHRYEIENKTAPSKNVVHEFKVHSLEEFFSDMSILLTTLGYPVFEEIDSNKISEEKIWYCKIGKTSAKAIYDETGFTIIKGSLIDEKVQPSFAKKHPDIVEKWKLLLSQNAKAIDKDIFELSQNITFPSLNQASIFCVRGSANGWITWKNKDGKTMDEVLRR